MLGKPVSLYVPLIALYCTLLHISTLSISARAFFIRFIIVLYLYSLLLYI